MRTDEIFNYKKVNEQLSTAGQPTEEQLRAAAAEGFQAVINLATDMPGFSLPDEAGLVHSLGMEYVHIPVDWQNPTLADFEAFDAALIRLGDAKVLVHCQANFRVTAFYGLYAMNRLGWSEAEAEAFRASIWQGSDYPTWEQFILDARKRITSGEGQQG